jgi:hypothetical protein
LDLVAGIIEEAAQKAKEGMEEWNGTDRPERKVFIYLHYIIVTPHGYTEISLSSSLLPALGIEPGTCRYLTTKLPYATLLRF